ncbi:hypothetical protein NDU88_005468 [Pleurodeles waltl]|uniref:Uncharacterized protein n=1 Tax=Pleurodeles waltl TaxID=8319 RepID=A0AAV7LPM8_PLEWA|nr:hypothetical protein NDU88_005468 [Pleurodeles waltl]
MYPQSRGPSTVPHNGIPIPTGIIRRFGRFRRCVVCGSAEVAKVASALSLSTSHVIDTGLSCPALSRVLSDARIHVGAAEADISRWQESMGRRHRVPMMDGRAPADGSSLSPAC